MKNKSILFTSLGLSAYFLASTNFDESSQNTMNTSNNKIKITNHGFNNSLGIFKESKAQLDENTKKNMTQVKTTESKAWQKLEEAR